MGSCAVQLCAKSTQKSVTSISTTVKMRDTIKSFYQGRRQKVGCTAAPQLRGCPLEVVGPAHLEPIYSR